MNFLRNTYLITISIFWIIFRLIKFDAKRKKVKLFSRTLTYTANIGCYSIYDEYKQYRLNNKNYDKLIQW